jgi:hypothetical protein
MRLCQHATFPREGFRSSQIKMGLNPRFGGEPDEGGGVGFWFLRNIRY